MGAQSLLALDLERCTRCDECTKACSDTHGGVTRLIREGLRFGKYLVASSCRSCHDPVCLIGCPVDAIHRRPGSAEIRIEETCIGCGRCAENCPYGNINMHQDGPAVARKATTCDQCHSLPGQAPNCVVACPHDAAHRMTGPAALRAGRAREPLLRIAPVDTRPRSLRHAIALWLVLAVPATAAAQRRPSG